MLTFFLLYLSEGLPYGFITTAMVFQLRGQGFGPEKIGTLLRCGKDNLSGKLEEDYEDPVDFPDAHPNPRPRGRTLTDR
jgi:hypothetical protein